LHCIFNLNQHWGGRSRKFSWTSSAERYLTVQKSQLLCASILLLARLQKYGFNIHDGFKFHENKIPNALPI